MHRGEYETELLYRVSERSFFKDSGNDVDNEFQSVCYSSEVGRVERTALSFSLWFTRKAYGRRLETDCGALGRTAWKNTWTKRNSSSSRLCTSLCSSGGCSCGSRLRPGSLTVRHGFRSSDWQQVTVVSVEDHAAVIGLYTCYMHHTTRLVGIVCVVCFVTRPSSSSLKRQSIA